MSRWTDFVKKWAQDHDTTYGCALSQPECRAEYWTKYGNRKKLPVKKERELMGMEDKDASEEIYILPKKKPKKKVKKPDNKPLMEELRKKFENKKELLEMSRMMGEDYNALKGKVDNKVAKIEKKIKKKKPELIIEEDEDEDYLKDIDKKELKRLVLEWFNKWTKIRGKINPLKKEWLSQDGLKIIEDFVVMYQKFKNKEPPLENKPSFTFTNDNFTPDKLLEFIREKLNEGSNYKVGQELLINYKKDLVKITKITPTMITFKYDDKKLDNRFQPTNEQGIQKEGHWKRTFTGKTRSVKKDNMPENRPVPPNFDYEWSEYTDYGF